MRRLRAWQSRAAACCGSRRTTKWVAAASVAVLLLTYVMEMMFFEGITFWPPDELCEVDDESRRVPGPVPPVQDSPPGGAAAAAAAAEAEAELSERLLCSAVPGTCSSDRPGCVSVAGLWLVRGGDVATAAAAADRRRVGGVTVLAVVSGAARGADPTADEVAVVAGLLRSREIARVCIVACGGGGGVARQLRTLQAALASVGTDHVLVADTVWALRETRYEASLSADAPSAPRMGEVLQFFDVDDALRTLDAGGFGILGALTAIDDGSRRLYRSCYDLHRNKGKGHSRGAWREGETWDVRIYRMGFIAAHSGGWVCDTTSPTFLARTRTLERVVEAAAPPAEEERAAAAAAATAVRFDDGCGLSDSVQDGLCGTAGWAVAERRAAETDVALLWQRDLFPLLLVAAKERGVRVGVHVLSTVFSRQIYLLGRAIDRRVGLHVRQPSASHYLSPASLDPQAVHAGQLSSRAVKHQPLPPCCCVSVRIRSLLGLFNDFMRVRAEHNLAHPDMPLRVLANEGTLHGIVKTSDVLPWDVDVDFLVFAGRTDPAWTAFLQRWLDYGLRYSLEPHTNSNAHFELFPRGIQDEISTSQMDIGHLHLDVPPEVRDNPDSPDAKAFASFTAHRHTNADSVRHMRFRRLTVEVPSDVGTWMTRESGDDWYTHRCDPGVDNDSCTLQRRLVDLPRLAAFVALALLACAVSYSGYSVKRRASRLTRHY